MAVGFNAGDRIVAPGNPLLQVFTASGTWTKPNGVRAARVRLVGGGGGGGGCNSAGTGQAASGGGGGGGYAEQLVLAASLSATETVTVGTGGAGGVSGTNTGSTGNTSSFGAHCSATGGTGGTGGTNTTGSNQKAGGNAGAGSGGDVNISGDYGGDAVVNSGLAALHSWGGGSRLGAISRMSITVGTPGTGQSYGGGAPGTWTSTASAAGAAGADGIVIVESIF